MAHRKLNIRFALILVGSLAVVCVGGYFAHGYQVRANAGALLTLAQRAQDEKRLEKAANYLNRYLSLAPTDPDALARYGLLLSDPKFAKSKRDTMRAIGVLEKALYRDPARLDLRRRIVSLSIDLGRYANLNKDIEALLKNNGGDAELHAIHGRYFEATGKPLKARECFEHAILLSPTTIITYERLANLHMRAGREAALPEERPSDGPLRARAAMDSLVKANAASAPAYLARAAFLRRAAPGNPDDVAAARRDVDRARELAPDDVEVLVAAAAFARDRAATDEARSLLSRAVELHPEDWRLYQELALLEESAGRPAEAEAVLQRGLTRLPDRLELLWQRAEMMCRTGRKSEANEALARLAKIGVPEPERNYLSAHLLIQSGQWIEAARKLESAIAKLASRAGVGEDSFAAQLAFQGGLLLGRCAEQIGDADRAFAAYSRIVARDPRSVPGRIGAAIALESQGRFGEALDQYRQLLQNPSAPPAAWLEVARLALLRTLDREPARRDLSEVEQALARVKELKLDTVQAAVLRAELLAAKQEFEQARTLLTTAFPDAKARPAEVWVVLAALDERRGRGPEAIALLDEAVRNAGDRADLRLAKARVVSRTTKDRPAGWLEGLAEGCDQFAPADRRRLLFGLAYIAMQSGDAAAAGRLWKRVADEQPHDLPSRVAMFDVCARANDAEGMERVIADLQRIEGGALWRYARASYLIGRAEVGNKSGLAEARKLLAEVSVVRSNWPRVTLCQARLDDIDQRYDAALAGYQKALQAGERDTFAFRRCAELLHAKGRSGEVYALIQRHGGLSQLPPELRRIGAAVALFAHDSTGALELAEAALAAKPKDYRDYLTFGRLYFEFGQPAKAGAAFERARELAPAEPDTWVALIAYLVAARQAQRAQVEVEAAAKQFGGTAPLALASCYETVGQADKARDAYLSALAAGPKDAKALRGAAGFYLRVGDLAGAETTVRQLLSVTPRDEPYAVWARRALALIAARQGNAERINGALSQLAVDENVDPAGTGRTRAAVYVLQNTRQSRIAAAKIFEELIDKRLAIADDHLRAAQLHESVGDWPRALRRYKSMLEQPGADGTEFLTAAARAMLRNGAASDAKPLVRTLEARDATAFPTVEFKARLAHEQGKTADAVKVLEDFVRGDKALLLPAAAVLNELGANEAAERLLRSAAEGREPAPLLALVEFYRSLKRWPEALDECDRLWAITSPEVAAQTALGVLADAPPEPSHFRRVERRLTEVLSKNPDRTVPLTAAMAGLQTIEGRYDEAERSYRDVLAKEPQHVTALNNLAWLLALRSANVDEALELLRRASQIAGPDAGLLDTRGVALLARNQPKDAEQAVQDLEAALAEGPSPAVYFHLAQAYAAAGKRREAGDAWRHARQVHGLTADKVHPLERPAFERLTRELDVN